MFLGQVQVAAFSPTVNVNNNPRLQQSLNNMFSADIAKIDTVQVDLSDGREFKNQS
jgi:hypothetical protein